MREGVGGGVGGGQGRARGDHPTLFCFRFKGLSAEEVLVYQAVEAAGDVGVWTKDLRARTNLQQPAVARMLKALESRGLVKAVRSVASGSRKVYMLTGVEPAR